MSAAAPSLNQLPEPALAPGRLGSALQALVGSWEGRIGVGLCAAMVLLVVVGPFVAPYDPNALTGPPTTEPSPDHWLGTDNLGRDVLSRFLSGGSLVLAIPLGAVGLALLVGGLPGMLAAYARGVVDLWITRTFDLLLTLPPLLVVLIVIGGVGTSTWVLLATVGLVYAPRVGRIARGATQAVVTSEYVLAAQARGERTLAILLREIAPNMAGPVVADLALRLTYRCHLRRDAELPRPRPAAALLGLGPDGGDGVTSCPSSHGQRWPRRPASRSSPSRSTSSRTRSHAISRLARAAGGGSCE